MKQLRHEEEQRLASLVLANDPESPFTLWALGEEFNAAGKLAQAEFCVRHAVELAGYQKLAVNIQCGMWISLGCILTELGQFQEAEAWLRKAVQTAEANQLHEQTRISARAALGELAASLARPGEGRPSMDVPQSLSNHPDPDYSRADGAIPGLSLREATESRVRPGRADGSAQARGACPATQDATARREQASAPVPSPLIIVLWAIPAVRTAYRGNAADGQAVGEVDCDVWQLSPSPGEQTVMLPPAVAQHCYGSAEQHVTLRMRRVQAADSPDSFTLHLQVAPPPSRAGLHVTLSLANGDRRSLIVPAPTVYRRSAWSARHGCAALPASAFADRVWPLTVEFAVTRP